MSAEVHKIDLPTRSCEVGSEAFSLGSVHRTAVYHHGVRQKCYAPEFSSSGEVKQIKLPAIARLNRV